MYTYSVRFNHRVTGLRKERLYEQDLSGYLESGKNCYVVVSEMANSRTKSNGSRVVKKTALAAMVLAGLSLSGMWMSSYAADNIVVDSGTATGTTNTVTDDKTARA